MPEKITVFRWAHGAYLTSEARDFKTQFCSLVGKWGLPKTFDEVDEAIFTFFDPESGEYSRRREKSSF